MDSRWTQPEIVETATGLVEAGMLGITIYITVVSGYLVVAYLAGKDLDRFQLLTISSLFGAFSFFVAIGSYSFIAGGQRLFQNADTDPPSEFVRLLVQQIPNVLLLIMLAGIVLSLIFMARQRRQK